MGRGALRAVHIGAGVAVALLVYLPVAWTPELRFALTTVGLPVLVVTGLVLWQQGRIRRVLGQVWILPAFVAAIGVAVAGQLLLQRTFATVGHPVSLGAANTEADPAVVRGWYAHLLEQGTLDRMVATELVDVVWIVGLAASVVLLTYTAARLLSARAPVVSARLARLAPFAALAPGLDLVENALSLAMLSDPTGFPDLLAPAHAVASYLKLVAIAATVTLAAGYALYGAVAGRGPWIPGSRSGRSDGAQREHAVPSRLA